MPTSQSNQHNLDTMLSKLIVQQGLATAEEVHDCEKFQRELLGHGDTADRRTLGDLLVSNGIITQRQLDRLRSLISAQAEAQEIPGFQVTKQLGVGAMATVYLAKQLSLDRMVAIKVLPRQYTDNPQFVERFYAEGKAAAKLNHTNIVGALDVGRAGDYHYFVMEYVEGRTVHDDLTENKRYSEKEALDIAIQITSALDHAHKAGLIHRDVKPKNIIITSQGVAKLADMGLARSLSDRDAAESELGKAFGTPHYISPEQIRGERDIDFRADIYCLGATFYHMVTGRVPFDAPNPSGVMQKHLKSELIPPDHINPSISAGIGEIIELCMTKDRQHRYSNTESLLDDLKAVARGEAPMVARQEFDLAVLAEVEPDDKDGQSNPTSHQLNRQQWWSLSHLYTQPIFWIAITGWALVVILILVRFFLAGM